MTALSTSTATTIGTPQAINSGIAMAPPTSTGSRANLPNAMAMFSTGTQVVRRSAVSTLSCRPEKVEQTTATQKAPSATGPAGRNCLTQSEHEEADREKDGRRGGRGVGLAEKPPGGCPGGGQEADEYGVQTQLRQAAEQRDGGHRRGGAAQILDVVQPGADDPEQHPERGAGDGGEHERDRVTDDVRGRPYLHRHARILRLPRR